MSPAAILKVSIDDYRSLPPQRLRGHPRPRAARRHPGIAGSHRGPDAGPRARAAPRHARGRPAAASRRPSFPLEKAHVSRASTCSTGKVPLHERYMLHPRVLDVLQALIGPDVLAMQTMLFLKPPGKPGQGWHQDSYYIPTHPDTLIGAWIAIDDCDESERAMWMAAGSQVEPVYPPPPTEHWYGDRQLPGVPEVAGVSNNDEARNHLSRRSPTGIRRCWCRRRRAMWCSSTATSCTAASSITPRTVSAAPS